MSLEDEINQMLEDYINSPAGKKAIKQYLASKPDDDKSDIKEMKKIGEDMKDILYEQISQVIKSFKKTDIIVGTPVWNGNAYELPIQFNEEALHRDSLNPEEYPEGVSDIVRLFVYGYTAKGSVRGVWKGHGDEEIWSVSHREPNDFMDSAVKVFNLKYKNTAKAVLDDKYKKV